MLGLVQMNHRPSISQILQSTSTSSSERTPEDEYQDRHEYEQEEDEIAGEEGSLRHSIPHGGDEFDRINETHLGQLKYFQRLWTAPISNPTRVLDCGTGTGIWAFHCAQAFPDAQVVGADIRMDLRFNKDEIPSNCFYEHVDLEADLPTPKQKFDLIYSRYMYTSIHNFLKYIKLLKRISQPSGWIEIVEGVFVIPPARAKSSYALAKWKQYLETAMRQSGMDPEIALQLEPLLESAGLVNVQKRIMRIWVKTRAGINEEEYYDDSEGSNEPSPIPSAGETPSFANSSIGKGDVIDDALQMDNLCRNAALHYVKSLSQFLSEACEVNRHVIEILNMQVRREVMDPGSRLNMLGNGFELHLHICYGQVP